RREGELKDVRASAPADLQAPRRRCGGYWSAISRSKCARLRTRRAYLGPIVPRRGRRPPIVGPRGVGGLDGVGIKSKGPGDPERRAPLDHAGEDRFQGTSTLRAAR